MVLQPSSTLPPRLMVDACHQPSTLDPRERDALYEGALGEEEEDDDREGHDGRDGHEHAPEEALLAAEHRQTELDRVVLLAEEEDQQAVEVVPAGQELEERDGRQGRSGKRPEDAG